jgi:hypothetical protein
MKLHITLLLFAAVATGVLAYAAGVRESTEAYRFGVRIGYVCGAGHDIRCFNAATQ